MTGKTVNKPKRDWGYASRVILGLFVGMPVFTQETLEVLQENEMSNIAAVEEEARSLDDQEKEMQGSRLPRA